MRHPFRTGKWNSHNDCDAHKVAVANLAAEKQSGSAKKKQRTMATLGFSGSPPKVKGVKKNTVSGDRETPSTKEYIPPKIRCVP